MNSMELENKLLKEENKSLKEENEKLKKLLENYMNSRKNYYEKNKETVIAKANQRKKVIAEQNPEKIKEYARRAYLKQKEKRQKILEEQKNETI